MPYVCASTGVIFVLNAMHTCVLPQVYHVMTMRGIEPTVATYGILSTQLLVLWMLSFICVRRISIS